MKKVVRLTESDLIRIVKKVINEQQSTGGWPEIEKGLISFNNPKVIRFNDKNLPITSLNWGSHSKSGYNWGVSVSSDKDRLIFTTNDLIQSKVFTQVTGVEPEFNPSSKKWVSTDVKLDFSNPNKTIDLTKKLINSLS